MNIVVGLRRLVELIFNNVSLEVDKLNSIKNQRTDGDCVSSRP